MAELSRRSVVAGLAAFAACPAFAETAWPTRRITLVHGFPPGGPVDTLSRILADSLSTRLGQPVVVEPKPGATGTTAGGLVARAKPDGYTLMAVPATYVTTAAMFQTLPYRPLDDFTFITTTAEYPLVLVTHPDSGIGHISDLIDRGRSPPAPLRYGTAGVGSLQHLTLERFAKKANLRLQHIAYKGGAPAIADLLGKHIDLVIDPPTALVQLVAAGKLRALAVTSASRFFGLPEVPTMAEAGFEDFVVTAYQGIAAPAGLPDDIAMRLNRELAVVLAEPAVIEKLTLIGNIPRPSSLEDFRARLAADIALWKGVVDGAHLTRI